MKLIDLQIRHIDYGKEKGTYAGKASFRGERGEVALNLNQHHCEQIFLVCADGIVDVAKASARMLVNEVMGNTEAAKQRQLTTDVEVK